jgi:Cu(I)/Ag(I) efflux system membrane fusion protein
MKRAILRGASVAAVIAAVGGAFVGVRYLPSPARSGTLVSTAVAQTDETVYYQDPDGKPIYSLAVC